MQLERIVESQFRRFKETAGLEGMADGEAFERFVTHSILSHHQPGAFASDGELLENVCVGGPNDMGIDGIAVKLNDLLIAGKQDAEDLLERSKSAAVEFIFIQSKYKPSFEAGEFQKFTAGVRSFLSEEVHQPRNAKVQEWLDIKDYLLSDDIVRMWDGNPKVWLYFISMGTWNKKKHPHISAHEKQFRDDMSPSYKNCELHYIDAERLRLICHDNENTFKETIKIVQSMPLAEAANVKDSCIAVCSASEYLKLLTTKDGLIRQSLFNSNVRDFQGATNVNRDIEASLAENPEKFCLLNNGITIVCDTFVANNNKITFTNPQIVNGCQTSHVLFKAATATDSAKVKIANVQLHVKIIATDHLDTTNNIVKANNNQNIVLAEAFEITRPFHTKLEEFFKVMREENWRIFYERRAKQYQYDPRIKQTDKVNLSILTKFFVGMFLNRPHMSVRHESKLLKEFEGHIYQDNQSMLPYFTTAAAFRQLETSFRSNKIQRGHFYSFRAHLLMLFRQIVAGKCPGINVESTIDEHSKKILAVLADEQKTHMAFLRCTDIFMQCMKLWTGSMKRSPSGMKDVPEFTDLLLSMASESSPQIEGSSDSLADAPDDRLRGRVIKVIIDRNGEDAGFIERTRRSNLFFHKRQNPDVDFTGITDAVVLYRIEKGHDGREFAVDVEREVRAD